MHQTATEITQMDLIRSESAIRSHIVEIAAQLAEHYCVLAARKGLTLEAHKEVSAEFNKIVAGTYAPKFY